MIDPFGYTTGYSAKVGIQAEVAGGFDREMVVDNLENPTDAAEAVEAAEPVDEGLLS